MPIKLFITISPPPRSTKVQYLYMDDLLHIKSSLKSVRRYVIVPELDPRGRLHYHGILTLSDHEYVSYYKECKWKLSRLGFVDEKKLDKFEDNLRVCYYIRKSFADTSDILGIPYEKCISFHSRKRVEKKEEEKEIRQHSLDFYGFTIEL